MNESQKPNRLDTEALYKELFASSPDAIVVVDSDGNILDANPQAESTFGYAPGELVGSPVEILIPERFRNPHVEHRREYASRSRMRPMGSGLELYGRCKDGREFPVEVMLSPVESGEELLVLTVIRDITERKRLEEEMRQLALNDPLTGLGNYRRLQETFDAEIKWFHRIGRSFALLLLDVDGLKKINDSQGHLAGSHTLCRLANAIRAACRAIDAPVRVGGDEFVVILPDTNVKGAQTLAQRIVDHLANDGETLPPSFSYGAAVYPFDGETLDQLLAVADRPLYEMKKSRRT